MASTQKISTSREDFENFHRFWNDELASLLKVDPEYFRAYDRLLQVASRRGSLSAKERELICLAVNAQVTYLNPVATRHHLRQASAAGATAGEIAETVQLSASLGVHSMLVGVPIAHEVFRELGVDIPVKENPSDEYRRDLKAKFIADRKYWSPTWDSVLTYSPEFFEAYLSMSRIPWESGPLQEHFKELIYIAIDVATTHLFEAGIRTHVKKAVEYGATPDQVIDVMTLASNIGTHTTLMGISTMTSELCES